MTAQISSAHDVVEFLKAQHEQIKSMFEDVIKASGDERKEAFVALRRLLAVHETAEEEIVHPRAKHEIEDGAAIVESRLQEEHEAKKALSELEKLDVDSAEFDKQFGTLHQDVLAHAAAEEKEEFSRLAAELDDEQLQRMRRAAELAESMAPTRPHAGVESKAANMMAGPFAMMLDRARDVMTGKTG